MSPLEATIRTCQRWDWATRAGLLVLILAGGFVLGLLPGLVFGAWLGLVVACLPPIFLSRQLFPNRPPEEDERMDFPPAFLAGPQWLLSLYASLGLATMAAAAFVPLAWWRGATPAADDLLWQATVWGSTTAGIAGLGWMVVFGSQAMYHRTIHRGLCELGLKLEEDPGNLDLWYDRGWLWQATGRLDRAAADYSELIWLDAESPENYYHRGIVLCELGDFPAALDDFTTAIELDPDEPSRYIDRAEAHLDAGQGEEAVADFTRAIELDPENPDAYEGRAEALDQLGQRKQAGRDWVKAERLRRRVGPTERGGGFEGEEP